MLDPDPVRAGKLVTAMKLLRASMSAESPNVTTQLEELVEEFPLSLMARLFAGSCYMSLGLDKAAIEQAAVAIGTNPTMPHGFRLLESALRRSGQAQAADAVGLKATQFGALLLEEIDALFPA